MAMKQVSVSVPQELDDAMQALQQLVMAVANKKSIADIVAIELPQFVKLLGEYQAIPDEVKTQAGVNDLFLFSAALAGQLLKLS